ncbi:MAG TPA: sulfite exporter TauE/SafE family protein [Terriglobales bacterium]|nr:sulfite exporter TauE/SafE family protein [Terriglobales bacterium]
MEGLSSLQLAVACLAAGAGALVQGSVGFGMALLASPILALISHRLVPGPLAACGLVVSLLTVARDWRHADYGKLPFVVPGLLAGSWAGATMLYWVPVGMLSVLLGIVVLIAVAISVAGLEVAPTRRNVIVATIAAGFLSTTASIPGPPLALVYQRRAGPQLAGTLAPIFVFSGAISLFNLHLIGRFSWPEIQLAGTMAPPVLLGLALSSLLAGRLPAEKVRLAVFALSALAGLAAILRGL